MSVEDQVFDVCTQLHILSCFVDAPDQKKCATLAHTLCRCLETDAFSCKIDMDEVRRIGDMYVRKYKASIMTDLVESLPRAVSKLSDTVDGMILQNRIQKLKLRHEVCLQAYGAIKRKMDTVLESQLEELENLQWQEISREHRAAAAAAAAAAASSSCRFEPEPEPKPKPEPETETDPVS